jgi:hypothetical protein
VTEPLLEVNCEAKCYFTSFQRDLKVFQKFNLELFQIVTLITLWMMRNCTAEYMRTKKLVEEMSSL